MKHKNGSYIKPLSFIALTIPPTEIVHTEEKKE